MDKVMQNTINSIDAEADAVNLNERCDKFKIYFFKGFTNQIKQLYVKNGKYAKLCKISMSSSIKDTESYVPRTTKGFSVDAGRQRALDVLVSTKDHSTKNLVNISRRMHGEVISDSCMTGRIKKLHKMGCIEIISEHYKPKVIKIIKTKI